MASLLDAFGNQFKGVIAQVNPFDNGETYNSVMDKERRKRQQASQPQNTLQVGQASSRPLSVAQPKPTPQLSIANQSRNSVVNRTQPGFDPIKAAGELGGWIDKNVVKPAVDFGVRAGNTVALPVEAGVAAATGANKRPEVQQALYRKLNDSLVSPQIASGKATPQEFAKDFINAGVEASNYIPTKGVVTGLSKGLSLPNLGRSIVNNGKLAGVLGTANTANDVVQGRPITKESLATNYAAPLALGVGSEALGAGVRVGVRKGVDAARAQRLATLNKAAETKPVSGLPINKLVSHEGAPDRARVDQYKKEILGGKPVEPILVMKEGNKFGVEDGKHRLQAMTELGMKNVRAKVITEADRKKIIEGGFVKLPGARDVPAEQLDGYSGNANKGKANQLANSNDVNTPTLSSGRQNDLTMKTNDGRLVKQNNRPEQNQLQTGQAGPNSLENVSRSSRQTGLESSLPDSKALIDRSLANNTPNIDTKQYVADMNKAQKQALKSSNSLKEKTSDFKEKFIDDLAPIEDRLNKSIKSGANVSPDKNITYQLDRSRRAEGVTQAYIRDNGLDKIIQKVPDTKEFDQYLIARHAKELDESVTTGRNAANDAALVNQLGSKYGEAAKELYKYNQKLLDTSVEYGLISKDTARALKKRYPEYVPFNRIFNEDELSTLQGGNGKGNASLSQQGAVKKIKGSERTIASPLDSIIDKTRVVVEQGERNRAAQMLASYRQLPGNPFNLKEISKNETIGSRNTIAYLDKGVKRVFETDKEIADAAKNMTRQEIGLWGRIAAVPARVLRGGATTVNVGFAGANVVKDVVGAAINSRHPFRIADPQAFGKALAAALNHNGKYYQELMREGVSGTSFDMYRNPLKSNVAEIRSHKSVASRAAYNATHPAQWYRTVENTIGRSEDFGRALQYYSNKSGFKADGSSAKDAAILAADQARSNSTNFFRHGSVGKGINTAIPYWNAGVQGARIQGRRIKERPVQTIAKIGFVIAAPSATIAMNNYGNETSRAVMESIPDYEKESNIIIVGPGAKLNEATGRWDGVFKIPVPPQHIGVHKTIQDAVRSHFTGKEFDTLGNLGRITEDYTTVNPASLESTANRYIPQGLKLIAEPMTNTNFFTGNKIVPDSQKNLPAADQYNEYTSGTAKVLGKITNTSPRIIDNTIKSGMGGAGQNAVNLIDKGLAATGAISENDVKGKNVIDSVTNRFYGANSINPSDKADEQFDKLKKQVIATDAYKNASQYDKSRMLNRLETDLSAVSYSNSGKSETKLTKKQEALNKSGFDVNTYTDLSDKSGERESFAERYQTAKEEFDNKSKTWTAVQKTEKQKELRRLTVQKDYENDIVDLYGMGKDDIANYLAENDGKTDKAKQAELLYKYDRALYDAGIIKTMKFKNGLASGKGGKGGKKGTGASKLISLTQSVNKIKAPKTASAAPKSAQATQMKKAQLKTYAVSKTDNKSKAPQIKTSKA